MGNLDDLTVGAALSRASSCILLGPSFNGLPTQCSDISDVRWRRHLQMEDEALEEGTRSVKLCIEPTFPIYLKFTDITYKVAIKGITSTKEKEILKGITGSMNPGEMMALMGPSGSGKTSLLNLLGGRLPASAIGGTISYNNQPYSKLLKSRIGFVTQDDVLFPHLTVKETLVYSALLRLSKNLSWEEKEKGALDVIKKLGLERCENTMIGGPFLKGISGGERKRVCIGNEILINPSILFLDEPTSGLDSTTAQRIVQILRDTAGEGKTIVTTIHQPSSTLFHKFDKLILLGRGRLLYYGKAKESMAYFSSIGFNPLIPMNPADFLLDLANGTINDIMFPCKEGTPPSPLTIHEYLVEAHQAKVSFPDEASLLNDIPLEVKTSMERRNWGASWGKQYTILFVRGIKERKHEYFSWLRVVQVIATSVVLGLLWWRSDPKTSKDPRKQAGLLFFIAVFWGFFPVFNAIFTFPQERAMLKKERSADMYRLSAYFAARTTSDLPLDLLLPVMFLVVVYFMAGLKLSAAHFFLTMLVVFLCIIAAQGMGLAVGATMMNLKMATTFASVAVMTFMLAGGYFVKDVPVFVAWLRYISFNYHTYKLLLKVQYDADASEVYGAKLDNGFPEIAALLCMVFGYRVLAYFSLRRMKLQS